MLQVKAILAIVSLVGLGSGIAYISHLMKENASLEAQKAGLVSSIVDANERINDYAIQTDVLQEAFKHAALSEGEFNQKVDKHDYEKLARRKPEKLESVLNNHISGMWDDWREITGYQSERATPATKTSSSESSAGDGESGGARGGGFNLFE